MNRKHNNTDSVKSVVDLIDAFQENNEHLESISNTIETCSKTSDSCDSKIIFIEPFYGGSHKQLIDTLRHHIPQSTLITLPAKKWPWRARCGALILSRLIPKVTSEKILFCSSVLNLAELVGLRSDLHQLKKIVYFHENQLIYPIRIIKERDVQYAYNQITTSLSADIIFFNSYYNKNSFLDNLKNIIKLFPDFRPKGLREEIEEKCHVLYYPVNFPKHTERVEKVCGPLHIIWPHRWEFDKDPETFIKVILKLHEEGVDFRVSILGETYKDVPDIFNEAKALLDEKILNFGFLESKCAYFDVLCNSHVVVSTARHEFFGVSMLEASYCGCLPLVPDNLVYPEIYPKECWYRSEEELYEKLKLYCLNFEQYQITKINVLKQIDFHKYSSETLLPLYLDIFKE